MIVVSDTSPVLNLARIGRLELLHLIYKQVLIPSAVFAELRASKRDLPPAFDLASEPWLIVASATDQQRVQELRENLDPGEAEAIVLAIEHRADLLLVDERRARRTATAAGLSVTGLLGVVARAKRTGLIDMGKPVVDELIHVARFWIGPDLYAEVLAEFERILTRLPCGNDLNERQSAACDSSYQPLTGGRHQEDILSRAQRILPIKWQTI